MRRRGTYSAPATLDHRLPTKPYPRMASTLRTCVGGWLTALLLCALAESLHQNQLVQGICRDFGRMTMSAPSTFGERHKC